jgi:hypothetical protein
MATNSVDRMALALFPYGGENSELRQLDESW